MLVLGIESSCDETSVALVEKGHKIHANVVASQVKAHRPYGGVVPELASRKHLHNIGTVFDLALKQAKCQPKDIDLIAVTQGPGLTGSLLIGISFARALAYSLKKKIVGMHHIEAHLYSPLLENPKLKFPFVSLVVSGGHTSLFKANRIGDYRLLGRTIDDAVGEAYDKVAKLMHLGYPGGPILDKLARTGNPKAIPFPRGMIHSNNFNFSFSGLKTAVLYHLKSYDHLKKVPTKDIAASFQEAVADVLVEKTRRAAKKHRIETITLAGGVACNSRLRDRFKELADQQDSRFYTPTPILCTDNAAMIAGLAYHKRTQAKLADSPKLKLDALPNWSLN